MTARHFAACGLAAVLSIATLQFTVAEEHKVEKPASAVTLFDGKDFSKWDKEWKLVDGAMEVKGGDIRTKDKFKDSFHLHIEFAVPNMPEATGQGKGNSGVYLQDNYEIQVLDSHGIKDLSPGDCAGIYNQKPADKNMSKPPTEWQTYDIEFTAPKWEGNRMASKPRVTIYWNGEKVHDNVEISGPTGGSAGENPEAGAIRLQDHGNTVRYRNIWIAPLAAK